MLLNVINLNYFFNVLIVQPIQSRPLLSVLAKQAGNFG